MTSRLTPGPGRHPWRGTVRLARATVRTGWLRLLVCAAVLVGVVAATGWSISTLYDTLDKRQMYAASIGLSPAVAAFNGRPYDLTELGGIVSYEVGFMGLLVFPLVAVHLAIRLTRHEEDTGRADLVTAAPIGRLAPLGSAVLVLASVLSVVGLSCVGVLVAAGLPPAGSAWYAASLVGLAAAYAGVGLLAAQVCRDARTAHALGMGIVLLTFLLRAVVDGRNLAATWSGPMNWLAEVRPWGQPAPGWLWALLALALVMLLLSVATAAGRDLGSGVLRARTGPATGRPGLGTPGGYAWRLTRGPVLGWLVGLVVWNLALGAVTVEMSDLMDANPSILELLGVERAEYLVTALSLLLTGVGAAALGVQGVARLAGEESSGRLGLVLSTHAGRVRVWSVWTVVVLVEAVVVLALAGLALGATSAAAVGDPSLAGTHLVATLQVTVPVALIVAVAAAGHAVTGRGPALGWLLVSWATVVGVLGQALRLPDWARNLSPLELIGTVPLEPVSRPALVGLATAAVLLVSLGVVVVRRRDLRAG